MTPGSKLEQAGQAASPSPADPTQEGSDYSYNDYVGDVAITRTRFNKMKEHMPAVAQDLDDLSQRLVRTLQKAAESTKREPGGQPKFP